MLNDNIGLRFKYEGEFSRVFFQIQGVVGVCDENINGIETIQYPVVTWQSVIGGGDGEHCPRTKGGRHHWGM